MNPSAPMGGTMEGVPDHTREILHRLVEAARSGFGDDLHSIVLFGTAAEGRWRPTSDINLMMVLRRFERARVDGFREPLRLAHVAARVAVMFILESELAAAAEVFAVKFGDIARRHRILYGEDITSRLVSTREARKLQLRQVLMNTLLRLREQYARTSLREEQLALIIADTAAPLRAAALTLCELEGVQAASPKAALEKVAADLDGPAAAAVLEAMSTARRTRALPAGSAHRLMFDLMQFCDSLRQRAERLT